MRITFFFHLHDFEKLFTKAAFGWKAKIASYRKSRRKRIRQKLANIKMQNLVNMFCLLHFSTGMGQKVETLDLQIKANG